VGVGVTCEGRRSNEKGGAGPDQRGTARAARHGPHKRGTGVSNAWALAGSGRERERRGTGRVGRAGKEEAWAEPEGTRTFLIYSNEFQTSSNCFDQKVDLPSSKNFK
jgi:hypothetical protein